MPGLSEFAKLLHRRTAQAWSGPAGVRRADGQLLPPPGARFRGAGQPGLLAARTVRRRFAFPVYSKSEKSKRIEFRCPDTAANPYLAVLGAADGRSRRSQEQDRSWFARPTSTSTKRAPRQLGSIKSTPGSLRGGAARRLRWTTLPARRGGFHQRPDRHLDQLQVGERAHPVNLRVTLYEFYLYFDV